MRGRLWLFVLLASALTFLVSLFLPWSETTRRGGGRRSRSTGRFVEPPRTRPHRRLACSRRRRRRPRRRRHRACHHRRASPPAARREPADRRTRSRARVLRDCRGNRGADVGSTLRRRIYRASAHDPPELDLRVLSRPRLRRNRPSQRARVPQERAAAVARQRRPAGGRARDRPACRISAAVGRALRNSHRPRHRDSARLDRGARPHPGSWLAAPGGRTALALPSRWRPRSSLAARPAQSHTSARSASTAPGSASAAPSCSSASKPYARRPCRFPRCLVGRRQPGWAVPYFSSWRSSCRGSSLAR